MTVNPEISSSDLTPDQALQLLMDGNQRFVTRKRENPHQNFDRIQAIAEHQEPFAALLGCSDSRVPPEVIFDQGLGDIFVVRVAGNIASLEAVGSEEYATQILKAKILMVLGHERCGAVKTAFKGGELPGVISKLIEAIQPALNATANDPGDALENAVKANVVMQTQRLLQSPVIARLVAEKQLRVVGGYYDLDTAVVQLLAE
ncbi:carbonic anhydrase [Neosynechococcus sphagnicola]|uniref:carbonic anhydrase n=1 Tax=Neosynechococcus sphagnicola TaxID=1501145 RepID=UPI00068962FE|nr:carbonic anhydrase [Neosynechococcus sphagnicola]